MGAAHLEVLVEEPSMEATLRTVLPRLLGDTSFRVYVHQSKAELLSSLADRMRGYARWLPPDWRILVLVDRDDDDCQALKHRLEAAARQAGLTTRSDAEGGVWQVVNRLAVEELEAWFFGDWPAVQAAYPRVPATIPSRRGYRDPDAVRGGTWEALERVLQRAGYFAGGLRKIEAARAIAQHLEPARNTSRSFRVLCQAVGELVAD